jgi:murein DD-endopeptidase MepM/ murein hydrolase activator NlpD
MKTNIKVLIILSIIALIMIILALFFLFNQKVNQLNPQHPVASNQNLNNQNPNTAAENPLPAATTSLEISPAVPPAASPERNNAATLLTPPISSALTRVTKKPFGIKVSPGNSPISPERFSGFHTGVDFETFPDEQNIDVPIFTVCPGKLIYKNYVAGYGGVAVESCALENQPVTIIYGHLKLASIKIKTGQQLNAGDKIGVLGKGYSPETDGERKHLHLGIHKGTSINLLGYVQNLGDLNNWLDATKYLQ